MGAVAPLDRDGDAAVRAIEAGCDLLLYCSRLELAEAAVAAMATRAQSDAGFGRRLHDAASAVDRLARRFARPVPREAEWHAARLDLIDASALG
jgi:beta-glucosidase-like glycosyl hydrolase